MADCTKSDERLLSKWIEERGAPWRPEEVSEAVRQCSCYLSSLRELARKYSMDVDAFDLLFADKGKNRGPVVDRAFLTRIGVRS